MTKPVPPIRKEITVEAPQERAFRVFTESFDTWWPREHHIGKPALKQAVIEPRAGGRWYEIGDDASECDWGKVLIWDPPARLVLNWQISTAWQYDPALNTELEIRFIADGPRRTRVELEHRNMENFGAGAEQHRGGLDSGGGWGGLLVRFGQAANGQPLSAKL